MSLINDALKRAKQTQHNSNPVAAPAMERPLQPIESGLQDQGSNLIWPVAIILFLLLFAGLFIAISSVGHVTKQAAVDPMPAPAPVVQVAAATPPPAPPVVDTPKITAPKPARIQGIVYDPVTPYAIISGKTVFVGDAVDGQRVTFISRNAITLVGNGQTNHLHVGEK
ncbi:MAG: hypothetical protein WDM80_00510 [Limisphaerales bacterium]